MKLNDINAKLEQLGESIADGSYDIHRAMKYERFRRAGEEVIEITVQIVGGASGLMAASFSLVRDKHKEQERWKVVHISATDDPEG